MAQDLPKVLLLFLAVFVIWVLFGGRDRYEANPSEQGIFMEPLDPLGSGETYGPANNSVGFVQPDTWKLTHTEKFDVYLPPGWTFTELQGVDSYVGEFTSGTTKITFDYGQYSTHLVREGDERYTVTYETIDNHDAELVRPKTAEGTITGVYIDHSDEDLVLSSTYLSTADQDLLFNIARTVEF